MRTCNGCPFMHVIESPASGQWHCWCAKVASAGSRNAYISLKRCDLVHNCFFEGLAAAVVEGTFVPEYIEPGRTIAPTYGDCDDMT